MARAKATPAQVAFYFAGTLRGFAETLANDGRFPESEQAEATEIGKVLEGASERMQAMADRLKEGDG